MQFTKEESKIMLDFFKSIEFVLDEDWDHSQACLNDDAKFFIAPGGTFLNPGIDDVGNNWANREGMLDNYNSAKNMLIKKQEAGEISSDEYFSRESNKCSYCNRH